tara:strand:- start:652 stop:1191 length:540 start_codon:yes stop_codon:yes gene_type:complete
MEINSDELNHVFNKCINEQIINIISNICEGEGLNYVEIIEKYGLTNTSFNRDYKPKKKRELKIPLPQDRCNAIASEGEQCRRSKKDNTDFCRRHKTKRTYGTINDKPLVNNKVENKIVIQKQAIENINEELEIEHKGNLITLEDGTEVIFIPTTGLCYSYSIEPELLGTLSSDFKKVIS